MSKKIIMLSVQIDHMITVQINNDLEFDMFVNEQELAQYNDNCLYDFIECLESDKKAYHDDFEVLTDEHLQEIKLIEQDQNYIQKFINNRSLM